MSKALALVMFNGPDWLVYLAAALLKHLESDLRQHACDGTALPWLSQQQAGDESSPLAEFSVACHQGYMRGLQDRHRHVLLPYLCSGVLKRQ